MGKIQIDSGRSSAATHRLTQASTTLNRRYVKRPSNIAVDEAARSAMMREESADNMIHTAPSRLVNLGIHAAELEKAKAAQPELEEPDAPETEETIAPAAPASITPSIVEFGMTSKEEIESNPNPESEKMPEITTINNTENAMMDVVAETKTPDSNNEEIDTAALAASIAADYAATSLGMSINEYGNGHDDYAMTTPNGETVAEQQSDAEAGIETIQTPPADHNDSVEAIALAASNAIASIRNATEPDQVSEQVASLKAFSENIKSNPAIPEMRELGDTIDKFVNIAMKSTKVKEENERKTAAKVALSPKITRAAAKVTKSSAKVMAANNRARAKVNSAPASMVKHPVNNLATRSTVSPSARRRRPSSQELKAHAIESALQSVASMEEREPIAKKKRNAMTRRKTSTKRFLIAFTCAAACVAAVITFVGSNIPDISVRVAAMQTGIQASYPSYVPRDYSLGDINSEDGKITMIFHGPDNSSFNLVEEKSSWDSSALLRNYVEPSWGEEYATTHEQGITIYISNANSDAAWVNGGVLYKINSKGNALTKKQVRSIVTSL